LVAFPSWAPRKSSDDAVFASSENPETKGRDAIQKALTLSFAMSSDRKVNSEKVEASGNLAYDYGTFSQHVAPPKS
jgi:ketosteroid isomerase-like protein